MPDGIQVTATVLAASRARVAEYLAACWPLTQQGSKHGQLDATRIHVAFGDPKADGPVELSLYDLSRLVDPSLGLRPNVCPECNGNDLAWGGSTTVTGMAGHGQLQANDVQPVVFLGCTECSATVLTLDLEKFLALVVPVLP